VAAHTGGSKRGRWHQVPGARVIMCLLESSR
jgi:hypothetical protein